MTPAMSTRQLGEWLLWCALLNYGALLVWFALFRGAHAALYRWLSGWFRLTPERFDQLNFAAMTFYKVLILGLYLLPYLALRLARLG